MSHLRKAGSKSAGKAYANSADNIDSIHKPSLNFAGATFIPLNCHGIVTPVIEPVPDSAGRVITRMQEPKVNRCTARSRLFFIRSVDWI